MKKLLTEISNNPNLLINLLRNDELASQVFRLVVNVLISIIGSFVIYKIIPKFKDILLKADMKGVDMSKKEKIIM
jgi:hypothetical protein